MAVRQTPKGSALWAKLFRPDTKFDADGVYSIKLRLPKDQADATTDYINQVMSESLDMAKKENPTKKGSIKSGNPPYTDVYDEQGNETGEVEFNFKQKAVIKTRRGTMEKKPAVFDAKGKPIVEEVDVGNGSTVKVAYEAIPYYTAIAGAGVSLRLTAVQLVSLVQGAGGLGSFKFEEEEGYEFSESDVKQPDEIFTEDDNTEVTTDNGDF